MLMIMECVRAMTVNVKELIKKKQDHANDMSFENEIKHD